MAEYLAAFPGDAEAIAQIFAEMETTRDCAAAVEPRRARISTGMDWMANAATILPTGLYPETSRDDPSTNRIGDYEIVDEIARGGMGVVYRARHQALKRMVAIKMILSGSMATADERARFLREAELVANLDHHNIVPIYEVGQSHDRPYFSMKLIDGTSLAKQTARFRDDPRATARLICTLAKAVDYAHARGFLHCDLKPSNVLLDSAGRPYITDFGLARRTGEDSTISLAGAILGTPSYMAPEQAAGSRLNLGPGTDIYGLGAILYELLTGRPPFRGATVMETVLDVLERDPAPPRTYRADVPVDLETICLKCLEKSPQERYPTAAALAEDLERYLDGEIIDATSVVARLKRWNRREPEVVSRLGGLFLIAVITQYNYIFLTTAPHTAIHYSVQASLFSWAVSAVVFQWLLRRGWYPNIVPIFWAAADIVFLTLMLKLLSRPDSALLIGYPIVVVASGLWSRVRMVWITTALASLAYLVLYLDAALAWGNDGLHWTQKDLRYPNIYIAGLILTGYLVTRQVNRIKALGQYYEQRAAS
jgi:serine/threonine-protein kinase